ncbi:MAG: chemotaxis protein CheW [Chloroflexi bacterium]|nr:chemotaxis protein CheW [Chloroflexota bacterium]
MRYLAFSAGSERYALPLDRVAGVQPEGPITRVPGATALVRGVMNLRGRLLAVVDLAAVLGLPVRPPGQGHVVVVRTADLEAGLLVDHADEILAVEPGAIEPRLSTLPGERAEFLDGQVRCSLGLVGLLRLERVLEAAQHG